MVRKSSVWFSLILAGVVAAPCLLAQDDKEPQPTVAEKQVLRLAEQVRKQVVSLPEYGVFDWLTFSIQGGDTVTLQGWASRPILKSSAENVVKRIEGVKSVVNNIKELPLSPNDNRIRANLYYRIYGNPTMQMYASAPPRIAAGPWSPATAAGGIVNNPPMGWHAIHLIVDNGNVILEGYVNNESARVIANMAANQTPGVFSVDNRIIVANDAAEKEQKKKKTK
jgi:hyperosmotically inducible periplasmic protein